MAKLHEKMETRRFLRSRTEARRRYSGPVDHETSIIDLRRDKPDKPKAEEPSGPIDEERPAPDEEE